jgi:hypothetical protein
MEREFKFCYRTETGTSSWECYAYDADEAEELFRDKFGHRASINGIYVKDWRPVTDDDRPYYDHRND